MNFTTAIAYLKDVCIQERHMLLFEGCVFVLYCLFFVFVYVQFLRVVLDFSTLQDLCLLLNSYWEIETVY